MAASASPFLPYWLSKDVHICRTEDQVVILDLARSKYSAIGEDIDTFGALVHGWPCTVRADLLQHDRLEAARSAIEMMLGAGLVTADPKRGRSAEPANLPHPMTTLQTQELDVPARIRGRAIYAFLASAATSAAALHFRGMAPVVRKVRSRKARQGIGTREINLNLAAEAVAVFDRLRPLAFTAQDKCLFDSLVLIEFLARMQIFPTWVIGVRTRPFCAHSWVQAGDVVLNDLHEHVGKYTPILVV